MSQTAITPWEPSKYASRRSARNPFSPMMSHTIISRLAFAPFHITSTVFFVTFVPTVAMYRSSNASCTYRLMRDVFPTATSPTKHTFTLTCFWPTNAGTAISDVQPGADLCTVRTRVSLLISIIGRRHARGESRSYVRSFGKRLRVFMVILDVWDWKQELFGQGRLVVTLIALGKFSFFGDNLPRVALFRNTFGEGLEGGLDVDARLRGREMEGTVVRAGRLDHLVLRDLCLVLQVDLVPQEFDRDLPGDAVDAFDPVVEIVERLPAGHVAHRQDPAGAVEVRLLEEFPEALLTHDVPDRHVDLQLARALGHRGRQFLLRDLRAERLDVLVVEVVQDEPTDERRLPDGRLADEAHLHFHPLDFHERPPRNVA